METTRTSMSMNELLYDIAVRIDPKPVSLIKKDISIDSAIHTVTGIHPDELMSKARFRSHTEPRQIAMFFYHKAGFTHNSIGFRFHRDHATVTHAINVITTYYGRKGEDRITEYVNKVSELTGIAI